MLRLHSRKVQTQRDTFKILLIFLDLKKGTLAKQDIWFHPIIVKTKVNLIANLDDVKLLGF
jgi:hypothetical protein